MLPDPQELADCLSASFLKLVMQANAELTSSAERKEYVLAFLESLSRATILTDSEKALRVRVVMDASRGLSRVQFEELAHASSGFSPALKNAVSAALPIGVRPLVYGRAAQVGARPVDFAGGEAELPAATPQPPERFSDVLLLTRSANQEANANLLAKAGFVPLRVENLAGLEQMIGDDAEICTIAIDGSFWAACTPAEVERAIRVIASYSTFAWIRIDDSHLTLPPAVVETLICQEQCLCGDLGPTRLYFRPDGRLSESELANVRAARERLRTASQSAFMPGEISDGEADLLWASVRSHAKRRLFLNRATVSSVKTTFLRGGMTNAKVAVVLMTERLLPVVVKIDSKDLIRDEASRFFRFIAARDVLLRPEVHFHGNCALLLFGLVGDVDDDSGPAPQLEVRLRDLWYSQLYGSLAMRSPPSVADLKLGIQNAVSKLGRLNRFQFIGEPVACFSAPHVGPLAELERQGVGWGFDEVCLRARERAQVVFKTHADRAVVHGDVQLRNVLLRADREAFLIDYAGSGPGHPCIDLVRLELSLFLNVFRQLTAGNEVVLLQRDISLGQLSPSEIEAKYQSVLRLRVNDVCLAGCLAAREEALAVLSGYGGGLEDYLAVKYLLAWQSLQLPDLQQGLVRAVIDAIAPSLS